ncbi:hypothetical protein, partial [Methylibium sp.]|uniref:hypothetical protein n=1 Tax=Methylibium sp. TaxID=2067992 RepID=UPI0017F9BA16
AADASLHKIHEALVPARLELEAAADALTSDDAAADRVGGYACLLETLPDGVLLALPVVTHAGTALVFATRHEAKAYPNNIFYLDDFTAGAVNAMLGIEPVRDDGGCQ